MVFIFGKSNENNLLTSCPHQNNNHAVFIRNEVLNILVYMQSRYMLQQSHSVIHNEVLNMQSSHLLPCFHHETQLNIKKQILDYCGDNTYKPLQSSAKMDWASPISHVSQKATYIIKTTISAYGEQRWRNEYLLKDFLVHQ